MPRLTRKNIKVFAGSATNNGVFGSLQANNPTTTSDVEQLQSLSAWSEGWNAATETSEELPPLEEIQGVEYVTTYQQAYIMQEGLPEWAATVTYYKGCLTKEVTSTGFKIYNSLTDNNTGNLLSDTSNWKKVMDSDDLYAFDNTVVHKTGNETIGGTKTFTNGMITNDILPKGSITLGTSTNTWGKQLQFRDTTGKRIARIQPLAIDTTNNRVGMWVNNADNTVEQGIYVDSDGKTSAPTPSAGDNSTKIATTAFVQTAVSTRTTPSDVSAAISTTLSSLYPVGSIYIGTQSTCPLSSLISGSQWQVVATSVVVNVNIPDNIPVYGNGKTLGVTNGSHTAAPSVGGSAGDTGFAYNGYNKAPTNSNPGGSFITNSTIGVVPYTDGSSGLIAKSNNITKTTITLNIWQRTA
jgi:hypothetical protein